jgi:hypothetical protein
VGQTESGKTIAAKMLACQAIKNNYNILVLDPIKDPEWFEIAACQPDRIGRYGFVTNNPFVFDSMVWSSQRCFLFIDESGEHAGHYDTQFFPWATRSRHLGHSAYFIAQRAQMIAPTIRAQCRYLLMFNSSVNDAEILSKEFNQPEIKNGALPQFEYYYVCRFKQAERGTVKIIDNWQKYRENC